MSYGRQRLNQRGALQITIEGKELNDPGAIFSFEMGVYHQLLTVDDLGPNSSQYKAGQWVMEELERPLVIKPSLAEKLDANGQPMRDIQQHPILNPDRIELQASAEGDDPSKAAMVSRIFGIRGVGSSVTIRYSPDTWWYIDARRVGFDARTHRYARIGSENRPLVPWTNTALEPDDVLLHELVHAARQMQGLWMAPDSNSVDANYPNIEEFFAVLVANIYVSERNTSNDPRVLRGGPYAVRTDGTDPLFKELDRALQDSRAFYERYKDQIGELCNEMVLFTTRLGLVKSQFNPIAVWKDEDERARANRSFSASDLI
jgi:hypothetical protein